MSQLDQPHAMTLVPERTALVVCDVQERLFPAMDADHREEVMRNVKVLATSARRLRVPILVTEQYPKGLGHTLQELLDTLGPQTEPLAKVTFSCCGIGAFRTRLEATGARHVVLTGIEAATRAGMRCLAVPNSYPAAQLGAADLVVPSLEGVGWERLAALFGAADVG